MRKFLYDRFYEHLNGCKKCWSPVAGPVPKSRRCSARCSASDLAPDPAMTTELWIATGNPKKRVELDRTLRTLGYKLRPQSEAPSEIHVVEDQPDFAGNAAKKALALANLINVLREFL